MALRKRFRRDEIETFTFGVVVEWLNGSQWLAGTVVTGSSDAHTDDSGRPYMLIRNTRATRTTSTGEIVRGYPGHVRPVSR